MITLCTLKFYVDKNICNVSNYTISSLHSHDRYQSRTLYEGLQIVDPEQVCILCSISDKNTVQ
jgi:hypothetical protein